MLGLYYVDSVLQLDGWRPDWMHSSRWGDDQWSASSADHGTSEGTASSADPPGGWHTQPWSSSQRPQPYTQYRSPQVPKRDKANLGYGQPGWSEREWSDGSNARASRDAQNSWSEWTGSWNPQWSGSSYLALSICDWPLRRP